MNLCHVLLQKWKETLNMSITKTNYKSLNSLGRTDKRKGKTWSNLVAISLISLFLAVLASLPNNPSIIDLANSLSSWFAISLSLCCAFDACTSLTWLQCGFCWTSLHSAPLASESVTDVFPLISLLVALLSAHTNSPYSSSDFVDIAFFFFFCKHKLFPVLLKIVKLFDKLRGRIQQWALIYQLRTTIT